MSDCCREAVEKERMRFEVEVKDLKSYVAELEEYVGMYQREKGGMMTVIVYYECGGCHHILSEEQFMQARFNYPCSGTARSGGQCGYRLEHYHPVLKHIKEGGD